MLAFAHMQQPVRKRKLIVNGEPQDYNEHLFWNMLATVFGLPATVYPLAKTMDPTVLGAASYILMDLGIIERVVLSAPWVTPPILFPFLATGGGIKAAVWAAIEIVLLVLLWTPFVMISNKQNAREA